ncbi:unnamed protein product [Dibothriocephalus latus]|uniref:Uncharacterized protein n=1 Tax=Dibothriocephalus latus TaxID=60516 RepID=A0A3P6QBU0_DIBLA|nr:unnamed protein product [Dibothriocephalus latus]
MDSFASVDRLEGSNKNEIGGLITPTTPTDAFKKPQSSLFGLDKLAERKRAEASNQSPRNSGSTVIHTSANYREPRVETPSYGGGVSKEYIESQSYKRSREQAEKFKAGLAYKTGHPFKHTSKGNYLLSLWAYYLSFYLSLS